MFFRERSEGRSSAGPRESSRLAETRKSARERRSSLLSRWLLLGEKPLAGFGMERRRRRTRAADDPESRLWTFTNASTLPVGVTTRVCTGGRACSSRSLPPQPPILLKPPSLPAVRGPSPSSPCPLYPVPTSSPLFVLLRAAADSFASYSRSCGPPRGEVEYESPVNPLMLWATAR